jgi:hypothetical protein
MASRPGTPASSKANPAILAAGRPGSEGLSSRLTGMLEALVADHARRDKQGELHGGVMRSRR